MAFSFSSSFAQSSSSFAQSSFSPARSMAFCCICNPSSPPPITSYHVVASAPSSPLPNTICASCLQAARVILQLHNPPEPTPHNRLFGSPLHDHRGGQPSNNAEPKGLARALKSMEKPQQTVQVPSKKVAFLDSLAEAFKTGMHCDVELVTDDGQCVQAHRVVMATKSPVFKVMFQVDPCKLADKGPIRIPDLNHNELKCLLEFLYTGNLPQEVLKEEHAVHVLLQAAHKYDIPFLKGVCESHIIGTLSCSNALRVLELSTALSAAHMKEMATSTILRNYEDIISSKDYEEFVVKNPMLALHLTKALLQARK